METSQTLHALSWTIHHPPPTPGQSTNMHLFIRDPSPAGAQPRRSRTSRRFATNNLVSPDCLDFVARICVNTTKKLVAADVRRLNLKTGGSERERKISASSRRLLRGIEEGRATSTLRFGGKALASRKMLMKLGKVSQFASYYQHSRMFS